MLDSFKLLLGGYENALIFTAILSFVTTLLLVIVTIKYVTLTKSISDKTLESVEITKDKIKTDRTLELINEFDLIRYSRLRRKKENSPAEAKKLGLKANSLLTTVYPLMEEEIKTFLFYFDKVATLYNQKRFDKKMFEWKLELYFKDFICIYKDEIIDNLQGWTAYHQDRSYYYFQNLLNLALEVLDKTIKNSKKQEVKLFFKRYLSSMINF